MGLNDATLVAPRPKGILDPRTGKRFGEGDAFFGEINNELADKGFLVTSSEALLTTAACVLVSAAPVAKVRSTSSISLATLAARPATTASYHLFGTSTCCVMLPTSIIDRWDFTTSWYRPSPWLGTGHVCITQRSACRSNQYCRGRSERKVLLGR